VPPLLGVAVNVTDVPVQMVVCVAETDTPGVTIGLTVTLTLLLVTIGVVGHGALDVRTHHTESILVKVLVPYVAELIPTLAPFFTH
jgi:hypothetical protein